MDNTIALVLGAGASSWLNFPLGSSLRKRILDLVTHDREHFVAQAGLYSFGENSLKVFVDQFKKSQMNSIDSFLARRREFTEIGKASIAALLLEAECQTDLFSHESKDNWYRYFFNQLASESWDELDFSKIKIITFNYDRSLEFFLLGAMQNAYGKPVKDVEKKLATLEIIHIYGSLGSVFEKDKGFLAYGSNQFQEAVIKAANNLRIIPEGRDDDPVLEVAQKLLTNSKAIAFMGFGFDPTNLKRLDVENTCGRKFNGHGSMSIKHIAATTMGLTRLEILKLATLLGVKRTHTPELVPAEFESNTCLSMLRETQIFDVVLK